MNSLDAERQHEEPEIPSLSGPLKFSGELFQDHPKHRPLNPILFRLTYLIGVLPRRHFGIFLPLRAKGGNAIRLAIMEA